MVCDRLVVGMQDATVFEKLQLDTDLTREKIKMSIRQHEAVKEQHSILSGSNGAKLDAVQCGRGQHN